MYDGTRYVAPREGGRVNVADEHVSAINAVSGNGTAGLLNAGFRVYGGRRKRDGRWCRVCQPARLWNGWNFECPKGHGPTVPESPDCHDTESE
jgi:hypothetical protein